MRPPIGASDFVCAVNLLGGEREAAIAIAALFGFSYVARKTDVQKGPAPQVERGETQSHSFARNAELDTIEDPSIVLPAPVVEGDAPNPPTWWNETVPLPEERPEEAFSNVATEPLFEPARQRDIIRRMIEQRKRSRRIDASQLAKLVARRAPFDCVPRLHGRAAASPIAIVVDTAPTMSAYRTDVAILVKEMERFVGKTSIALHSAKRPLDVVPAVSLVVIVSDLRGRYAGRVGEGAVAWVDLVRSANAVGVRSIVLVPATVTEEAVASLPTQLIEWSRATRATSLDRRAPILRAATPPQAVLTLATALSLAVRIEPALVRAMRLRILPDAGPEIEGSLRSTSLVDIANALGFTFRKEIRARLMRRLEGDTRKSALAVAASVIDRVHASGPPILRLEETVTRLGLEKAPGWEDRVAREIRSVTRAIDSGRPGLARWVEEAATRLPTRIAKTGAIAEAAVRSEGVLGRRLDSLSASEIVPSEEARYLRQTVTAGTESIAFDVEIANATAFDARTFSDLSEEDLSTVAERLHASVDWLRSVPSRAPLQHHRYRYQLLERELARAQGRLTTVVGFEGSPTLRERIDRAKGFRTTSLDDPSADGAVVVDGTAWPSRLANAMRDPGFIVCKIEFGSSHTSNHPPNVIALRGQDEDRLARAILQLVSFAEGGFRSRLRVVARKASSTDEAARMDLPSGALARLDVTSGGSVMRVQSSPSRDRVTFEGQREPWTLGNDESSWLSVQPLPRAWIARLYASTCRVVLGGQSGKSQALNGCLVSPQRVLTAGLDLPAGAIVSVTFGDENQRTVIRSSVDHIISGFVDRIDSRIAAIQLERPYDAFQCLTPEGPTVESGAAMTLAMPDSEGPGHLAWGRVRRNGKELEMLVYQRDFDSIASFTGAPVILENKYVGHVVGRAIRNKRGEGGWILPIALTPPGIERVASVTSPEPSPNGKESSSSTLEYEHDVYVSYSHEELGGAVRQIVSALEAATFKRVGKPLDFFVDERRPEVGDNWPAVLDDAVMRSRVLLAFVTPTYLESAWARREWGSFAKREENAGAHLIAAVLIGVTALPIESLTQGSRSSVPPMTPGRALDWFYSSPGAAEKLSEQIANLLEQRIPPFDASHAPSALDESEIVRLIVKQTSRVFISASPADRDSARRIVERLRSAGIEAWFDDEREVFGGTVTRRTREAIERAIVFIPVLSQSLEPTGLHRAEWDIAFERAKSTSAQGRFAIVPVVVSDTPSVSALPSQIQELTWVTALGGELNEGAVRMLRELTQSPNERAPSPP